MLLKRYYIINRLDHVYNECRVSHFRLYIHGMLVNVNDKGWRDD